MTDASPSAAAAAGAPSSTEPSTSSHAAAAGPSSSSGGGSDLSKFKQIAIPSAEQMMQEDAMNNCVVKTVLAGVFGGIAGVAFGLFTASIENSGGVRAPCAGGDGCMGGAGRPGGPPGRSPAAWQPGKPPWSCPLA
jgi:hypothetical protein